MIDGKPRVLYLTYDGLLEPLGQSQVLSYLEVNCREFSFTVLSFEKQRDLLNSVLYDDVLRRVHKANIGWKILKYHKRPPLAATSLDIICGVLIGLFLIKFRGIKILHARSYVAGVIALLLSKIAKVPYIFDIRGFWIDERIEGGLWRRGGLQYHVARWFEAKLYHGAAHITTLTQSSINYFPKILRIPLDKGDISVIPTCTDVKRFSKKLYRSHKMIFGNLGSLGTWYELDPIFQLFVIARRQTSNAGLIFINRDQHHLIRSKILEYDIDPRLVQYFSASQSNIPKALNAINVGLLFYRAGVSRVACSPTRFAEYLSAGIPCLISAGVGDTQEIVEREGVGIVLSDYQTETLERSFFAIKDLMSQPDLADRCRDVAKKYFSLEEGASKYSSIYFTLSNNNRTEQV